MDCFSLISSVLSNGRQYYPLAFSNNSQVEPNGKKCRGTATEKQDFFKT